MIKLTFPAITALANIVTGNCPQHLEKPVSPYRTFNEILRFFESLQIDSQVIVECIGGSRQNFAECVLDKENDTETLSTVIKMALHPRHFANTDFRIDAAIEYLNREMDFDGFVIVQSGQLFEAVLKGHGGPRNTTPIMQIIFASNGPKPEIVFDDALSNKLRIVKHETSCLIYSRPVGYAGLTYFELRRWWLNDLEKPTSQLLSRLRASLDSEPERIFFNLYYIKARQLCKNDEFPALLPQVYFHYDPKTIHELEGQKRLVRQRMDFLLLFPNNVRIVVEIDGKQHYATDDGIANPKQYAEMVAEDRKLKLAGYDVYRIGGYEFLEHNDPQERLSDFITQLFEKYGICRKNNLETDASGFDSFDDIPF